MSEPAPDQPASRRSVESARPVEPGPERRSQSPLGAGIHGSLSETLWDLRWSDHLPHALSERVTVHVGEWERIQGFLQEHAPQLVEQGADQIAPRTKAAKARFFQQHSDLLEFRVEGETVGLFLGEPADWSTYYCRAMTMDSRVGPRGVIRKFVREVLVKHLCEAGVERLVGDTLPTNRNMIRIFVDLGFQPSGQNLTDRWGTMVRFSLFLNERAEQSFARRYSSGG